ncbi:hypothetical protein IF2G_05395 [Cordyceps javanica]|nr:hypothetical protein IF2G_05395 [Cordyceps javanica]
MVFRGYIPAPRARKFSDCLENLAIIFPCRCARAAIRHSPHPWRVSRAAEVLAHYALLSTLRRTRDSKTFQRRCQTLGQRGFAISKLDLKS